MIVYLDQNKWIELARMVNGKDTSPRATQVIKEFDAALDMGHVVFPLSAFHYMESARISNAGRRSRLGEVMWTYSKGATIAFYLKVVKHELEMALSKHIPEIRPGNLQLLGRGSTHAFGDPPLAGIPPTIAEEVERALLVGSPRHDYQLSPHRNLKHQENFKNHLASIKSRKFDVPPEKREDWLYALLLADMREAFLEVFQEHHIPVELISRLIDGDAWRGIIDDMPTRKVDLHLHKQILRNPNYASKITDLEDWGGVGVASCYCDVVICEKHMADMLRRDRYCPKARIETKLENTFIQIGSH